MPRAHAPLLIAGFAAAWSGAGLAPARAQQTSATQVAIDLGNPIYYQYVIPLQNNYDCCFSPEGGYNYTLNIEPVIPIRRIGDIDLVSRTVIPITYEVDNTPGQGRHAGVGDTTEGFYFGQELGRSFFFGGGPIFLIPSNDPQLSDHKWASGPTFAVGGRSGPFTASLLFWQYWSFAGAASAPPVSRTRLEPQIAYVFPNATVLKLGVDADYDWVKRAWSAPFHAGVAHVFKARGHAVQLALEGRAVAVTARGAQTGVRFTVTWILPKR